MKTFLLCLLLSSPALGDIYPNYDLTPGAVNPELTKEKICSKDFRTGPYRDVSEDQKKRIAAAYKVNFEFSRANGEYDHLISLELGGSNDDKNIWWQPYETYLAKADGTKERLGAHEKDLVENRMHKLVCDGDIDLERAQNLIVYQWADFYEVMKESNLRERESK